MKRFSVFCLPALVMAGALLLFTSCQKDVYLLGAEAEASAVLVVGGKDLSASGSANCYIVSSPGEYSFKAVKGNSDEALPLAQAEVLWESFGTTKKPEIGSVISLIGISYENNRIIFKTPSTLKNGNAVIAAKDKEGKIVWSWHIWVCEGYNPEATGQVYYSDAGTMMDRNLGATSATPGEVESFGLLYQWGRKDPFLGSKSLDFSELAASTLDWPAAVSCLDYGTINYTILHPTTFIYRSSSKSDWLLIGSPNNDLWKAKKNIYDPCPYGWKVPAGGEDGVWATAVGSSVNFKWTSDFAKGAMTLSGKLGDAGSLWYPAAGSRDENNGDLSSVGAQGHCWSYTPSDSNAYAFYLYFTDGENKSSVYPKSNVSRAAGYSVRCVKE